MNRAIEYIPLTETMKGFVEIEGWGFASRSQLGEYLVSYIQSRD